MSSLYPYRILVQDWPAFCHHKKQGPVLGRFRNPKPTGNVPQPCNILEVDDDFLDWLDQYEIRYTPSK